MANVTWRDFEGRHEYSVIDDVIYQTVVKNPGSARRQMQAETKCVQFARSTNNEFIAHSFAIYGWLVTKLVRSAAYARLGNRCLAGVDRTLSFPTQLWCCLSVVFTPDSALINHS